MGQQVRCPKCKAVVTIPGNRPAADPAANPAPGATETAGEISPFSDLMVYDQAPVEIDDSLDAIGPNAQTKPHVKTEVSLPQAVDPTLVAVSRRVLYLQAVMIASATLGAFVLGYLIGSANGTGDGPSLEDTEPVSINGRLTYENRAGKTVGDSGSIVIALPIGLSLLPDEKLVVDGLGPLSKPPLADDSSWASFDAMGGSYCRTDNDGGFRIILTPGKYYVLFISRHTRRSAAADLPRRHLAEMGGYFQGTLDLIGDQKFVWLKRKFDEAAYLSHQF